MKRKQADRADRKKLSDELAKYPNPLTGPVRQVSNIVNGCVGNDKVNVHDALELGEMMMVTFAAGLPEGIYNPIRSKLVTLESCKKAVKIGNKSIFDMEKLYGRMLVINQRRKLSIESIFSYELAPVPASLFDEYGRMRKGDKSPLASLVSVTGTLPGNVEVVLIDGGMMLHHVSWPKKGKVRSLCAAFAAHDDLSHHGTYVIFDKYDPQSIKSHEREARSKGVQYPNFTLSKDTDLPPKDAIMKSTFNKKQLIFQLCTSDVCNQAAHMIGEDDIYGHEEADVSIITYVKLAIGQGKKVIKVLCDDTDVLILLIHFTWKWDLQDVSVYMERKCDGKVFDITKSAAKLGDTCTQLIGLHALTGCDTVSYPYNKGKVSAMSVLKKHGLMGLSSFGDINANEDDLFHSAKVLFSHWYGCRNMSSNIRAGIFESRKNPPRLICLPPTDEALKMHVRRSHLQAILWKSADREEPPTLDISKYGWQFTDDEAPSPCHGVTEVGPMELMKVVACGCAAEPVCSRNTCSCKSVGISCTTYCNCCASTDTCANPFTSTQLDEDDNESGSEESGESDDDDMDM